MTFTYEPITAEQVEKERQYPLLDPGIYNFQVIESTFKTSSTGNPMIVLKLMIWDKNGKEFIVFDYLVGTNGMAWKTRHF